MGNLCSTEGGKEVSTNGEMDMQRQVSGCEYESPEDLKAKAGLVLPAGLDDVNADFMEKLLRYKNVIPKTCKVTSIEKKDVGMTAGYFSSIARVQCTYSPAQPGTLDRFIVKA